MWCEFFTLRYFLFGPFSLKIKQFSLKSSFIYVLISKFVRDGRSLLENNKIERKWLVGWILKIKITKFGVLFFLWSVIEILLGFHIPRKSRLRLKEFSCLVLLVDQTRRHLVCLFFLSKPCHFLILGFQIKGFDQSTLWSFNL